MGTGKRMTDITRVLCAAFISIVLGYCAVSFAQAPATEEKQDVQRPSPTGRSQRAGESSPFDVIVNVITAPFAPKTAEPRQTHQTQTPADEIQPLPEKTTVAPAPLPLRKFENLLVWESFEDTIEWTVEAAQAPATIGVGSGQVTDGLRSLRVAFTNVGRQNIELRREVRLDLTQMEALLADVYVAATEPMQLAILFRVGPALRLYETPPVTLVNGWNRDIVFDLRAEIFKSDASTNFDALFDGRDDVRRISLLIGIGNNKTGVVEIDNIRFAGKPAPGWEKRRPAIEEVIVLSPSQSNPAPQSGSVMPPEVRLKRFETLCLRVKFQADYTCAFDPMQINLFATFVDPNGAQFVQPGYLDGIHEENGAEELFWLIKFTPSRPGRWDYFVSVRAAGAEAVSPTGHFTVDDKPAGRGFIRRSITDPRYFEFDDGTFFYPLGLNVCWTADYESHFRKMAAAGANLVRIWMCPWNLFLEGPKDVGLYDLDTAARLDEILEQAQRYGIYVQLVIEYHGMLTNESWSNNPYNVANGGPCETKESFFINPEARNLFKRRLRYIAARWGASPALFAWELMNEADLADSYTDDDVVAWHNEMATALKSYDAHKHLITTSAYGDLLGPKLVAVSNIDFAQDHIYNPKAVDAVLAAFDTGSAMRIKPYFIGEFGAGTTPDVDQQDKRGNLLHGVLWASFMLPIAGNALPWWWDTFIEPNNLYYHWRALANFAAGEDRRGKTYIPIRLRLPGSPGHTLLVLGMMTKTEALFWVVDPTIIQALSLGQFTRIPPRTGFVFVGMEHGEYSVEFWDTYKGTVIGGKSLVSDKGRLKLTLPVSDRDIACKLKFLGKVEPPGVVLQVDEQRAAIKLGTNPDERTKPRPPSKP